MEEPVDEKVLEQLRKLMAHRDSAEKIGSEKEAQAFAEKVQYLLNKHKLEESDIHEHEAEKRRVAGEKVDFAEYGMPQYKKPSRVAWTEKLGRIIAENYFCRILIYPGSNTIGFVGRPTDREIAVFVYVTLARFAFKMADSLQKKKELVRHLLDEPIDLRNFKESFYAGFIDGIRERLEAMKRKFTDDNPGFALVLLKSEEELEVWFNTNTRSAGAPPSGGKKNNALGYAAGKEYAKDVPIQTGVTSKGQKRLG